MFMLISSLHLASLLVIIMDAPVWCLQPCLSWHFDILSLPFLWSIDFIQHHLLRCLVLAIALHYHGFLLVALWLAVYMWSHYPWMDHSWFHSSTFMVLPFFDIAILSSIVIFNPSLSLVFHCLWTLSFIRWSLHGLAQLGHCHAILLGCTCFFKHIQISTFSVYWACSIICHLVLTDYSLHIVRWLHMGQ